ncbi:MAG: hypothetical protein BVN35_18965 [Proteobacteria bacterium ST_bin11]|nr:MAG: hypothetical protein BVN35_18965 [Proteobacteria bacterium ST_bin11]
MVGMGACILCLLDHWVAKTVGIFHFAITFISVKKATVTWRRWQRVLAKCHKRTSTLNGVWIKHAEWFTIALYPLS